MFKEEMRAKPKVGGEGEPLPKKGPHGTLLATNPNQNGWGVNDPRPRTCPCHRQDLTQPQLAERARTLLPVGPAGVTMHCSASWLCSPAMSAATVRTQYCVLGFRYLKWHGASSPLRLQGTWEQRGRVAKVAGGGVCALLHSPVQPRHPTLPVVWSTDPLPPCSPAPSALVSSPQEVFQSQSISLNTACVHLHRYRYRFFLSCILEEEGDPLPPPGCEPRTGSAKHLTPACTAGCGQGWGNPTGTGTTTPVQLAAGVFAAPGKLLQVLWPLSLAHPTTYLLDERVPFVQTQPVPQLQQHFVDRLVQARFASVGSERHDDIYAEDVTLEHPGQLGGAYNCCKETKKKKKGGGKLSPSKQRAGTLFL